METLTAAADVTAALVRAYGIAVTVRPASLGPVTSARFSATAYTSDKRPISGHGAGSTEQIARTRAVMECVERLAQFGVRKPPGCVTGRLGEIPGTLTPAEFGLYRHGQYSCLSGRVAPFTENMTLEWVPMRDLRTGGERLVPAEVVYPRASLGHLPLVLETSSGTAAHVHYDDALLTGLCEAVERDAVLVFWHRQPPTPQLPVESVPGPVRDELHRVQAAGYVVAIADLTYDLRLPCYLVLALRGRGVGYGLGCHPDPAEALAHAVRELGARLAWMGEGSPRPVAHLSIASVSTGDDHYGLYHHGPLHGVLRDALNSALRSSARFPVLPVPGRRSPAGVVSTLAGQGLSPLAQDITPHRARDCGAVVVRTVVPGLVPFYMGAQTIRLGAARLTGSESPGRLRNLLPHFLS